MTSHCETWTVLLWVTSPVPGGFACTRLKCLRCTGIPVLAHWAAIAVLVQLPKTLLFLLFVVHLCICTNLFSYRIISLVTKLSQMITCSIWSPHNSSHYNGPEMGQYSVRLEHSKGLCYWIILLCCEWYHCPLCSY